MIVRTSLIATLLVTSACVEDSASTGNTYRLRTEIVEGEGRIQFVAHWPSKRLRFAIDGKTVVAVNKEGNVEEVVITQPQQGFNTAAAAGTHRIAVLDDGGEVFATDVEVTAAPPAAYPGAWKPSTYVLAWGEPEKTPEFLTGDAALQLDPTTLVKDVTVVNRTSATVILERCGEWGHDPNCETATTLAPGQRETLHEAYEPARHPERVVQLFARFDGETTGKLVAYRNFLHADFQEVGVILHDLSAVDRGVKPEFLTNWPAGGLIPAI